MDLPVREIVFVDVWTPEVAPEVAAARRVDWLYTICRR